MIFSIEGFTRPSKFRRYITTFFKTPFLWAILFLLPSSPAYSHHVNGQLQCPDVEENGEVTVQFSNVSDEEYIELPDGQTTFTVTADATVSGHCEIWGYATVQSTECSVLSSRDPYISALFIWRWTDNNRYLSAIDNQTGGQAITLSLGLSAGVHRLEAHNLAADTLCNLFIPNDKKEFVHLYVNTIPPKEEFACSGEDAVFGNPCDASNGNKHQYELDFQSPLTGLSIGRYYNSNLAKGLPTGAGKRIYGLGYGWTASFLKRLDIGTNVIHSRRANGNRESFIFKNNTWQAGSDGTLLLSQDASGYTLTRPNSNSEHYNLQGSIDTETINGLVLTYSYDGSGNLQAVTNSFGHSLSFTYGDNNQIATITTPTDDVFQYDYDTNNNLVSVTYPDTNSRTYHYENGGFISALTGITDENNSRYSTYGYTSYGWADKTQHAISDNVTPQENYELSYQSDVTVTDPRGKQRVLDFDTNLGVKKLIRSTNLEDGKVLTLAYDGQNNLTSRTDEEDNQTTYVYNSDNQKESMTEAAGTPSARTTTYSYYSPAVDLVTSISRPSVSSGAQRVTTISYDAGFNVDTITETGYQADGTAISRATDLDFDNVGRVVQINGPRTDVSDITQLAYYACSTGNECGQLQTLTNALGHTTTFNQYDANGRVSQSTDALGVVSDFTYDGRGKATSITQTPPGGVSRTTAYSYHATGLLHTITTPIGLVLTHGYDDAHDLKQITDNLGNKIEYRYDLSGNKLKGS